MSLTTWQNIPEDVAENYSRPTQGGEVTSRVLGGTLTNEGGPVKQVGSLQRVTDADLAPQNGGILGTARNNGGFRTANITPESTVDIPGVGRTSVAVAAHLGYLTRTTDGRYVEAGQPGKSEESPARGNPEDSNSTTSQQQEQQPSEDGPELFDADMEAAYGDLIRDIPQGTYNSMMGGAIALVSQGDDIDTITQKMAERYASAAGVDLDKAGVDVEVAALAWQDQADGAVKAAGADPAEFYEWAKENRRSELQHALNDHLFGRSTKAYRELVNDYFNNTMPTVKALEKAGIPTKTGRGETMVKLKGHWMSLASAVKAGFV